MNKKYIIVVCRGNIGRSPFAEAIIKREIEKQGLTKYIDVSSRGVQGTAVDPESVKFPNITYYEQMYADAKPVLNKFNVDLSKHISRPITQTDVDLANILLAVDQKTVTALNELYPNQYKKIYLISRLVDDTHDITDPEGANGEEKQTIIFTELQKIITEGFPKLVEILQINNNQ